MDFVKFKKYLNKNNIYMFDSDYRIVHFRLNNIQNIFNNTQTGGSNVIKKVKRINKILLSEFISSLLNKDINKINSIVSLILIK